MRFPVLPCLCLIVLLAIAPFAHAQSHVFHCIGAHGEPVFSGQPCGNPVSPPTLMGASNTDNFAGSFAGGRGGVCAASPGALRQSIAGAFANRDVNRLAGLILWRGIDQSSARAALRSLAEWLKQPLLGIASAHADGPPDVDADADAAPLASSESIAKASAVAPQGPGAFEISTGGADGRTRDFGVTEFGGCWWLTF